MTKTAADIGTSRNVYFGINDCPIYITDGYIEEGNLKLCGRLDDAIKNISALLSALKQADKYFQQKWPV